MIAVEPPPEIESAEDEPGTVYQRRPSYRLDSLLAAFRFAFAGLWYLLSTQRNAQIHLLIGANAVALGLLVGLARWEWAALLVIITMVLGSEGVNTAIEAAVDVACPTYHPLAKIAKDVAAGTVLLCAIAAVLMGCLLFLPHLVEVVPRLLALLQ